MSSYKRHYMENRLREKFVLDDDCELEGSVIPAEGSSDEDVTIVGVSGGPGMPKEDLAVLSQLAEWGYEVCLYDQHNVGDSDEHSRPYELGTFHRGLEAVMESFERVVLLGHSWGSMLVLDYLSSGFVESELGCDLLGMVLVSPLFDSGKSLEVAKTLRSQVLSPSEMKELRSLEAGGEFGSRRYEELERKVDREFGFKRPMPDFFDVVVEDFNDEMYREMWGPAECVVSEGAVLEGWSVLGSLDSIEKPVFLVSGEDDLFGVHDLFMAERRMDDCTVEIISNASHKSMWEQPEYFLRVVSEWLEWKVGGE